MGKEQNMAEGILAHVGGKENLKRITHCMTRLRLALKDETKADYDQLKQDDGVMGVIADETLQIMIGPGTVNSVAEELSQLTGLGVGEDAEPEVDNLTFEEQAAIKKENIKRKNKSPFKNLLRRIGNIFSPLIPCLVASGIINVAARSEEHTSELQS